MNYSTTTVPNAPIVRNVQPDFFNALDTESLLINLRELNKILLNGSDIISLHSAKLGLDLVRQELAQRGIETSIVQPNKMKIA